MNDDLAHSDLREAWALSEGEVQAILRVRVTDGLSPVEAASRLAATGPNELRILEQRGALRILVDQLRSTVVALLALAAALSFAFGAFSEGVAIFAVIVINTLIGFAVELRAVRSMDALRSLGSVKTRVRRSGTSALIPAEEVVPGDVLILEGGDMVVADARIIEASRLRADESTFTGESVPVDKHTEAIDTAERIDQRLNMLFKGTSLTMGSCEAVVVSTGMDTELGRISALTESAGSEATPLEKQLARVGNKLIFLTIAVAVVVAIAGILAGKPTALMIEAAIALAVATIPEGLPIVATIALARGLGRMARRNALINKLSAVETLGATSVICTDKTGTLTENRMRLARVLLTTGEFELDEAGGSAELSEGLRRALEIGVLCNRASLGPTNDVSSAVGDPLEVALLVAGMRAELSRTELVKVSPEVGGHAFDSASQKMATFHRRDGDVLVAVKGSPESVIASSSRVLGPSGEQELDEALRKRWLASASGLAERGLRVIAVAEKHAPLPAVSPYEDLTLVALLGLIDPPRLEVRESIASCRAAGIRILMITGDHPATAGAIARAVGLAGDLPEGELPRVELGDCVEHLEDLSDAERERIRGSDLFARVSPAQKLNLIRLHQDAGTLVGMIGDGVNDAPALEQADIGIAMGRRGTQVAREAAEMVLTDDSFSSIAAAVEHGRAIFGNIRKFVVYLLSCNVSEVMVLAIASAVKEPLPILPLQILFLNLVSDIFPALALGVGAGARDIMRRPPRDPSEGILTRANGQWIAGFGLLITASVLSVFYLCLGPLELGQERAVTVSFLTLAFAQLWHVFNMRDEGTPVLRNEITGNPFVWGALVLCALLLAAALYVPILAEALELVHPTAFEWLLIGGFSLLPLAVGQVLALRGRGRGEARE